MKRRFSLLLATIALAGCQDLGMMGPDAAVDGINAELVPGNQLVITGFDAVRGGIFAIADGGSAVSEARAALEQDPPDGIGLGDGVSYVSFNTLDLTAPGVATAHIMVLYVALNAVDPIGALSMDEQTALHNYVLGGGCAVLIADNDHTADPAWVAANASLVAPFGMTVEGMFTGDVDALIVDHSTTLTDPPGRKIDMMGQLSPGLITDLGPNGIAIAAVPGAAGDAMALIKEGDLGPGSGPVIVFSDVNSFLDAAPFPGAGFFGENKNLWLNTMDYCFDTASPPPPPPPPPEPTVGEAINDLLGEIQLLVDDGAVTDRDAAKLVRRLEAALKVIARDGRHVERDATRKLEQFIREVQRLVDRNKLSAEDGQALIDAASAVIQLLALQPPLGV